jgi:hypothetical protein
VLPAGGDNDLQKFQKWVKKIAIFLITVRPHQPAAQSQVKSHMISRAARCWDSNLRPRPSRVATLTAPPLTHLCSYIMHIPLVLTSHNFKMNI